MKLLSQRAKQLEIAAISRARLANSIDATRRRWKKSAEAARRKRTARENWKALTGTFKGARVAFTGTRRRSRNKRIHWHRSRVPARLSLFSGRTGWKRERRESFSSVFLYPATLRRRSLRGQELRTERLVVNNVCQSQITGPIPPDSWRLVSVISCSA